MALQQRLQKIVTGLKNRNEEVRGKYANTLQHFVTTELREATSDQYPELMEQLVRFIYDLVNSADVNEKKGGILAIVGLIGVDGGNATRTSRFANYLRNMLPCNDVSVMEMVAKAVGRLAQVGGTFSADYVEFEVKKALEWLSGDRHEGRRHAAVLVLRELAVNAPTFFFQHVQSFFDHFYNAVRDVKPAIREGTVEALRACFAIIAQRETKKNHYTHWYQQVYDEAKKGFEDLASTKERGNVLTREDKVHGSLLVMQELIRNSSSEGERLRQQMEDVYAEKQIQTSRSREFTKPTRFLSHQSHHHQHQMSIMPLLESGGHHIPHSQSRFCKEFMDLKFDEVCTLVLRHKSSKSSLVQHTLLTFLPQLAAFKSKVFVKKHLPETIIFMSASLKKDRERSAAFEAIGLLAVAVKSDIIPHWRHWHGVLESIKILLPNREPGHRKKTNLVDPMVFACVSMTARAVGPKMAGKDPIFKEIIDQMLGVGLSPALTAALRDLATIIPASKKTIQDGLLNMLSQILMHRPLRHPGVPKSAMIAPTPSGSSHFSFTDDDVSMTTLALRTLGTFDFEGNTLTRFISHCADNFLSSEHKDIRIEAVRTCSYLLTPTLHPMVVPNAQVNYPISSSGQQVVSEVLSKLLTVGITDPDPDIRFCVLSSLDTKFDAHLAQAENLQALFIALNDEEFEIRELALCTIGRLCSFNPAYIMPSLRKTLIQILTELEYSGMGRNKEQSARMLAYLVSNAPRLIRPYMEPILKALVPKLKDQDPNPGVVTSVLAAIGELAQVSGVEMRKYIDELFLVIIDMLQDASSLAKREVALWTLGQLVESTGYVVEPYKKYPNLLEVLLNFLKTEQSPGIRKEAIRVLGLLGALDPYKYKEICVGGKEANAIALSSEPAGNSNDSTEATETSTSEMLVTMGSAHLEEFYPAVAIAALMRIMRDPALSAHHTTVIQAVHFIFNNLGMKGVQYLPQLMPSYLNVIRTCEPAFREFILQMLGKLISVVKQHIRNYLDEIFDLIKEYWVVTSLVTLQNTIIDLIEQLAGALSGEFKLYLPQILPHMLKVFINDRSEQRTVTCKLLAGIQKFGQSFDDYLHLLIPPVVKLFDSADAPKEVRQASLETLGKLCECVDLREYAARIIHPLIRVLDLSPDLRPVAMNTLTQIVTQMGKNFSIFIPAVYKVLAKHRITHQKYECIVTRIQKSGVSLDYDPDPLQRRKQNSKSGSQDDQGVPAASDGLRKLHVSANNLQKAWVAARRVSKDDWMEWLRRLSVELLKESPSPVLRSCQVLAQEYNPLARDLFNAAFVSCWSELTEDQQDGLVNSLEQALKSQNIQQITQTLLNLSEFMEHCEIKGTFSLNIELLGECATKCLAYAKALHYKEIEFSNHVTLEVLESLISINNKLQNPEAANGVLVYATKNSKVDIKVQQRWFEKLHDWEHALDAYETKHEQDPNDHDLLLGRMRCLEALGKWGELNKLACENWQGVSDDIRHKMARTAASAAWGLGEWESMEEYTLMIPRDKVEGAFFRAVLALHQNHFTRAHSCIDSARDMLDTELTAMVGESYNRAYAAMVTVQMLSELEEVIEYKLLPDRRESIKQSWWDRLQGCQPIVEDWQKIIKVHSLVLTPQEDMRTWLKYASLCRKSGQLALSHQTLVMLLGVDPAKSPEQPIPSLYPQVTFAYMKHMWKSGQRDDAFRHLHHFVRATLRPQVTQVSQPVGDDLDCDKKQNLTCLLAKCYMKLGDWMTTNQGINSNTITEILQYYAAATANESKWYKAWHSWALMNYESVLYYKNNQAPAAEPPAAASPPGSPRKTQVTDSVHIYTVPAVQGFFRSISLSKGNSLQDTLRLLTLWFEYGHWPDVNTALVEGLKTIQIDNWLQVIPQLIARIDTPRQLISGLIHQLLSDVGKQHPQALIYPVTVASKSASVDRREAANQILTNLGEHSPALVQQAMMVSEELIRVAILWHELWAEGLEEASRLYFGERNIKGMFTVLDPLHQMMERGPQTLNETSFQQAYGRDLMEAQDWCRKYQKTGSDKDLTQAWDLYYHVFRRISKQLPQLSSLELQYVSPKLLSCRDLELAVPGTYEPDRPITQIKQISTTLNVITSKQRPRKLSITGSNGAEFMFLLKGHEDLRQDERVMQLFGLVNTLLANDSVTFKRHLSIHRYAVIPLSTNSGLIGWVPHCDTLHTLIRDYRDKKKILLNIEHRIMLRMAPDYEHLTLMQKVEVFEHALANTHGDDLAKVLWLKSPSSEVWFDRRLNYTRSIAVMSIVGYVLGLGDRHPSNLMLDRMSGKILHIDFGDCFEVAMTREKFPEKIPFRLTRMLINAMEVTGIDGNYRMTCESVMRVLRENKDSLMAVLEAFVYDPLLNWRLIDTQKEKRSKGRPESYAQHNEGNEFHEAYDRTHDRPRGKKPAAGAADNPQQDAEYGNKPEAVNKRALQIVNRVKDKLTGRDFNKDEAIEVEKQVDLLIQQATSHANLCQAYIGWCPFW
ncbi:serine/threonine-protein kinase mTOR-like [Hydractinia symbiolongicarpus]|uniref:serine/threonine-protein kinase mTOR-like n=1 Tax=Hydractinia symbiolongicarpus TaxID=13093 RepID=UPI00254C5316|nr:serine/threonine-protein kinase mTOR-like [Hydractinia symbiolongicarpus]